jgi:hypothetical protein
VSLLAVVLLSIGTAAQRLAGMFLLGRFLEDRPGLARLAELIPVAIIAAVIAQLTLARGQTLVVDARLFGLGVAAVLVARRLPLVVVVVGAAVATGGLRALT